MANTIKIKRYALDSNIPATGLNPGEFIMALDTGNLYISWTATTKILLCQATQLGDYLLKSQNLNDLPDKAAARTNLDVYSKGEVDNLLSGLNWKADVLVVATTNITLTALQTIDGVAVPAGARVGVVAQTNASQNGIYIAASGAWQRSNDANVASELLGATFGVAQGSTQADTIWRVFTDSITIGTTNIDIQPFTGIKNMIAGLGIAITGNTIDVALEELTTGTVIAADDFVIIIDVSETGQARQRKITRANFLTGIVSDTYQVKVNAGGTAGYLDDKIDVVATRGLKKTIAGDKVMLEMDINAMNTIAADIDAVSDMVPVYDASGTVVGKVSVNSLIKNALIDGGSF
jgi:hypothetical protein